MLIFLKKIWETFAKRRAHDRTRVSELLADLDSAKLGDKYAWIPEYLSIRGNTKVDLVNLLADQNYDGPFIYRPDNSTSGLMSNMQSMPGSSTASHVENMDATTSTNSMAKEFLSSKASASSSSIPPNQSPEAPRGDHELGIAGFLPERGPTSSLEHEYWLRDISHHVGVITPLGSEGAKALRLSVVLGHRDPKPPLESTFDGGLLSAADHILEAAVALKRSFSEYQRTGLCSTFLPVLIRRPIDNAVEIFDIQSSEVDAFTISLSCLVDCLHYEALPEAQRRRRQTRNPYIADTTLAAIDAGYDELQHRGNTGKDPGQTAEAFPEARSRIEGEFVRVQYQVTFIFSSLGYVLPSSEVNFHNSPQFTLDMAARCIQTLSLALQSFSQGLHGELDFSFLDRPVDGVLIRSLGFQNSFTIRAYGEKLTCLDGMTGGPVLVFEICTSETQKLQEIPREPCDLTSSWENIQYIWGNRKQFEKSSRVSNFPWIRNGIVHPSQTLTKSSN